MDKRSKRAPPDKEKATLLVRLPRELKAWIEREATHNGASQNSEIIRSIRARMEPNRAVE
jgi:Arc-like DNA binding domain